MTKIVKFERGADIRTPAFGLPVHRWCAAVLLMVGALVSATLTMAADAKPVGQAEPGAQSVPRFASLKPDKVNLRSGPGTEYPTVWVYRRAGMPLEILKEYQAWREVRDADGASGWVLQTFLSGRRTALVEPWEVKAGAPPPLIALYADDSEKATLVAKVEAGVVANVHTCDTRWCWVSIEQYKGYVPQKKLWGVYPAETIK